MSYECIIFPWEFHFGRNKFLYSESFAGSYKISNRRSLLILITLQTVMILHNFVIWHVTCMQYLRKTVCFVRGHTLWQ